MGIESIMFYLSHQEPYIALNDIFERESTSRST
ncbi:Uncharacterised protein [Vibrio cholerae]|nr:Uncharacterised protein [Vibrio cholerae]CSD11835.1 Uncharacterised protein [Vibrio cholerae]